MSNGPMSHRVAHLYGLNMEYRQACSSYYLLPPSDDCARYTLQELGEQDDVVMRMMRDHQRNNVRPADTFVHRKELGQALCLSLDILLGYSRGNMAASLEEMRQWPDDDWFEHELNEYENILGRITILVGYFLYGNKNRHDAIRISAYIVLLCDFFGYNPIEMVHERYAQVREKWGQNAVGEGGQEPVESGKGAS